MSTPPFEPIACDPRSRTAYAHNAIHDLTAFALTHALTMPCPLSPIKPLCLSLSASAFALWSRLLVCLCGARTHPPSSSTHASKCSKQRLQLWRMAEAWEKREREAAPTTSTSTRPDGSLREPVRVREGYVPPDEQPRYEIPRPLRSIGVVLKFDAKLGWGFIRPDDCSAKVFVHHTGLQLGAGDCLEPGDVVSFERQPGFDGDLHMRAVNVLRSEARPASGQLRKPASALVPRAVAARSKRAVADGVCAASAPAPKRTRPPPDACVLGVGYPF